MDLVRRVTSRWQARRAAEAERDIREWHEACLVVLEGCLGGLRDPQLPRSDIGVTLDKVDRALFRVRDAGTGARQALKRRDPGLAARVRRATESVVELRNQTASFLIRAQGPTPPYLRTEGAAASQPEAYRRAQNEVGQAALARAMEVEIELGRLFTDMQDLLGEFRRATGQG